jgi:hypothetical protein
MPQYGEEHVGKLPDILAAMEGCEPENVLYKISPTPAKIKAGRRLVGKKAFGCVECHDMAGVPSTGTRGPDLAFMSRRVRYDWYRRWLEQPDRMQPGTRMPSVFPEGKSTVLNVLGGNPDAQAEAMWIYLSQAPAKLRTETRRPPQCERLNRNSRKEGLHDLVLSNIALFHPDRVGLLYLGTVRHGRGQKTILSTDTGQESDRETSRRGSGGSLSLAGKRR